MRHAQRPVCLARWQITQSDLSFALVLADDLIDNGTAVWFSEICGSRLDVELRQSNLSLTLILAPQMISSITVNHWTRIRGDQNRL